MPMKVYASEEFVQQSVPNLSAAKPLSWLVENYPELVYITENAVYFRINFSFQYEEGKRFPSGFYVNDYPCPDNKLSAYTILVNGVNAASENRPLPYFSVACTSYSGEVDYKFETAIRQITMLFSDSETYTVTNKLRATRDEVLTVFNTGQYTPTSDYHPATKKYVDDGIAAIPKQIQSDWNQADEAATDHVLNRTHYYIPPGTKSGETIMTRYSQAPVTSNFVSQVNPVDIEIVAGNRYVVQAQFYDSDGTAIPDQDLNVQVTAYEYNNRPVLGSGDMLSGIDPVLIDGVQEWCYGYSSGSPTSPDCGYFFLVKLTDHNVAKATITITGLDEGVHPLEDKWIPNTIARKSDIPVTEYLGDAGELIIHGANISYVESAGELII